MQEYATTNFFFRSTTTDGDKIISPPPPNKLFIFLWKKTCQNLVNDLATWGSFKKDIRILKKLQGSRPRETLLQRKHLQAFIFLKNDTHDDAPFLFVFILSLQVQVLLTFKVLFSVKKKIQLRADSGLSLMNYLLQLSQHFQARALTWWVVKSDWAHDWLNTWHLRNLPKIANPEWIFSCFVLQKHR